MVAEHALKDYVCYKHQCLASKCGCLEDEQEASCPRCGMRYQYFGGQHYCPECDFVEMPKEKVCPDCGSKMQYWVSLEAFTCPHCDDFGPVRGEGWSRE